MGSQQSQQTEEKIRILLEINPIFSEQMKQEILDYTAEANDEDLKQILHGLAAEDNARGKILQMNATDLRNLAAKISKENKDILNTFSTLIQQAEQKNLSNPI